MRFRLVVRKTRDLFDVKSGDFHATKELDPGTVPLISCGDGNNGLVGYFDIPPDKTYQRAITVAYNGSWPLTAKFHPYTFGAKDDVAVLVPREPTEDIALFYVAAQLNRMTWRYSYGRKCFRQKLQDVSLMVPVARVEGRQRLDGAAIAHKFPYNLHSFLPDRGSGIADVPSLPWHLFNILEIFDIKRGDFHSISELDPGSYATVSRVAEDNGVVGKFDRPDGARVYRRGLITVSTVGGDAFVQLEDFIATDNVVVCTPKLSVRVPTLFFVAFALNQQKWRYSYGRQCYSKKLTRVNIYLPVGRGGAIDEDLIEHLVRQASYWPEVAQRFGSETMVISTSRGQPRVTPVEEERGGAAGKAATPTLHDAGPGTPRRPHAKSR